MWRSDHPTLPQRRRDALNAVTELGSVHQQALFGSKRGRIGGVKSGWVKLKLLKHALSRLPRAGRVALPPMSERQTEFERLLT
jgi:hypothetical protein